MKKEIVVLCALLATASVSTAQNCAAIKPDKKRLECYDAATKSSAEKATSETKIRYEDTLRALRKIAGSTEIGISMRDYSQLVLEQVGIVDESLRKLPESDFKTAAAQARKAYVDARTVWSAMYEAVYVTLFLDITKDVLSAYPIDEGYMRTLKSMSFSAETSYMNKMTILSPIWKTGRESLEKAEKLAGSANL